MIATKLRPIIHKDEYSAMVERRIIEYFTDAIYQPLLDLVRDAGVVPDPADQGRPGKLNAKTSAVRAGLDDGRIWYANGAFTGRFTPAMAKELRAMGAKFSETTREFRITQAQLPADVKFAAADSAARSKALHDQTEQIIGEMEKNIATAPLGLNLTGALDRIVKDLGNQFVTTTVTARDAVTISAEITPAMQKSIDVAFTNNLDLYIRKFSLEQLPQLRKRVQANLFAGGRADRMAAIIEQSYGVSKRKAAFLGEQETSLLVSKYREERYKEIGSESYTWATSHDERVRPDHKALNGTIHTWSSPPVTNRSTGARNNPGEDFRCRCVAIPILVFPK